MLFETKQLVVRPPEMKDAPLMLALVTDPDIIKFNCYPPLTIEDIHKGISERDKHPYRFVMALKEGDVMVGEINIERDSLRHGVDCVMFSYNMLPAYQGKGYMKEVLRGAIAFCFNEKKVTLVSARVFADNPRSQHMLISLGFTLEGMLRRAVKCNEVTHDDCLFSMLKEEYDAHEQII